jgi:hypothetical protein
VTGERPAYTGEPVAVVQSPNEAEAEFVRNLLREEGIPAMVQRPGIQSVLAYLQAPGPRDVLVPRSALTDAREVLQLQGDPPPRPTGPSPLRLLAVLVVLAVVFGLVLLAIDLQ